MLKKILTLKGIKQLTNPELKDVDGGFQSGSGGYWECTRYSESGGSHTFYGNQSSGSASAWENAWQSLGWYANCTFNPYHQT